MSAATTRYDVFLSHNSADKPAIQALADSLRAAGIAPFLDIWHLIPGTPWQEGIEEALEASATVAVFIGPSGISPWHNEQMRDALDRAVRSRDDYRVIPVLLPGADEAMVSRFLTRRMWVDFRSGLDDDAALQRLIAGITGQAIEVGSYKLPDDPAPYRGLLPFEAEHARFFFGREADTKRLISRLAQHPFVAVVGASGSGKSSLVKAGLMPQLGQNAIPDSSRWRVLALTPGSQPLRSLANQIATLTPAEADRLKTADALIERLQARRDGLHTAIAAFVADTGQPVVLFIDQFEELFTLCQEEPEHCRPQAEQFVANLADAVQRSAGQVRVLITLRADFLDCCLALSDLRRLLEDRQLLLGSMDEPALREAIVRPAQAVGALFEKGLIEIILRDVGTEPGLLPLLQQSLYELWLRRRGPWLTLDAYDQSGGVLGALQTRADDTYNSLTGEQQKITRSVFLRLTALGEGVSDTRRRVQLEELYPAGEGREQVDTVLRTLSSDRARLIVVDRNTVEVAHEVLTQRWPLLHSWLEESRDGLRSQRRMSEAARDWEAEGRDESYLYHGAKLAEAEDWVSRRLIPLNSEEQDFLAASLAARDRLKAEREAQRLRELQAVRQLADEQQRRIEAQSAHAARLRQRALYLAIALVVALVGVAAAVYFWRSAERNADLAQQQLAQLEGERLLSEARAKTAFGDVNGAIANLQAAVTANPNLGINLSEEIAEVRRQVATRYVQEGERLAAADQRQEAAAKFKAAGDLAPPQTRCCMYGFHLGSFSWDQVRLMMRHSITRSHNVRSFWTGSGLCAPRLPMRSTSGVWRLAGANPQLTPAGIGSNLPTSLL